MANENRLIDAKVFSEHLERMARTAYPNLFPGLFEAAEYAKDFPKVDAVEVVRCRDCKHWDVRPINGRCTLGKCLKLSRVMGDSSFCSYGERNEGDGNG